MPDRGSYPEATSEQLEWMESAQPILADGSLQTGIYGVIVVGCVDSRPNWRTIEAQWVDDAMKRLYHPDFIQEYTEIFQYRDDLGDLQMNHKAANIWRYEFIRPYKFTEAGGRFAQGPASLYVTANMHGVMIDSVCLTQHDDCSAASGPTGGNRVDWSLAIQLTIHDLWRYKIGPQVHVCTGSIRTHGTKREFVRDAMVFDWQAYDQLVQLEGTYKVNVPSPNCERSILTELRALPAHQRSCLIFEDFQLNAQVRYKRYLKQAT